MKRSLLAYTGLLVIIVGLQVVGYQDPQLPPVPPAPEAYPGQRNHQKPPDGFFCSPHAKDAAHKCACKRMAVKTKEDPDCCDAPIVEDKACTVYCHMQHCLCPTKCEVPPPVKPGGGGHEGMDHSKMGHK